MGDAGEEAGAAARHGEVGDVADVAVEDRLAGPLPRLQASAGHAGIGEGADHREGGEVDADRLQAGPAQTARRRRRPSRGGRRRRPRRPAAPRPPRRARHRPPGARAPPGRAASGSAPGPGSGPRRPSPAGSSIAGRRRVRTTTLWLPTPSRTRLESLCSPKSCFRPATRPSGSSTSPSWKTPGSSGCDRRGGDPGGAVRPLDLGRGDAARLDVEADDRRPASSSGSGSSAGSVWRSAIASALLQSTERPQTFRPATTHF